MIIYIHRGFYSVRHFRLQTNTTHFNALSIFLAVVLWAPSFTSKHNKFVLKTENTHAKSILLATRAPIPHLPWSRHHFSCGRGKRFRFSCGTSLILFVRERNNRKEEISRSIRIYENIITNFFLRIFIICDDVYLLSFIFSFTRSVLLRQPLIIPHFPHFLSKFLPGYTRIMRPNTYTTNDHVQ